jgi:hypothetical protein
VKWPLGVFDGASNAGMGLWKHPTRHQLSTFLPTGAGLNLKQCPALAHMGSFPYTVKNRFSSAFYSLVVF